MTSIKRSTVVGVFNNRRDADQAVEDLRKAGFRADEIGAVMRGTERTVGDKTIIEPATDTEAEEGATAGAITGGVLGGALALASGLIPGFGPLISIGTLAATVFGVAAGAAGGGIVGWLIGMDIPEDEARYYESEVKSGRILVTVKAGNRFNEAWDILRRHGAYDVHTQPGLAAGASKDQFATATGAARTATARQTTPSTAATAGAATGQSCGIHTAGASATEKSTLTAQGQQKLQVREEELHAHKQAVQTGEVQVRKEVKTEQKTLEVPVTHEEVIIERRPVCGTTPAGEIKAGQEIRIPVKEEQVHVEKTPVVKEEVIVGKRNVHETETVGGTVRKEEVHVEQKGDVKVRGNVKGTPPPSKK